MVTEQVRPVCTEREPIERGISVIVIENSNRESRQETEKRKKERCPEKREGQKKREETNRQTDSLPETLPCVRSKRSRVKVQNAHM